jgi:hypothetical protein
MADSTNIFGTKRNIDVVFCIDGTGSMSPCIESVKSNALRFHKEFIKAMTDAGAEMDSMRVKIVVFRDYKDDGEDAMQISPFYELPSDDSDFAKYIASITATGGGDEPENGLEALYLAMNSDFTTKPKDRQVIVLFTDADALPLGERKGESHYPADMVDLATFKEIWACTDSSQDSKRKLQEKLKRLVMFAPAGTTYEGLKKALNRSVFEPVNMGAGLKDIDFKDIIKIIAASASNA